MAFHLHCLQCFRSPSVPSVVPVDKIIYKILHSPMASTVRISDTGRILLGELAQETHSSMTEVLDAALDAPTAATVFSSKPTRLTPPWLPNPQSWRPIFKNWTHLRAQRSTDLRKRPHDTYPSITSLLNVGKSPPLPWPKLQTGSVSSSACETDGGKEGMDRLAGYPGGTAATLLTFSPGMGP